MHYASFWACFSGKGSILLYNLSASEMGTWIHNSLAFCSSQTDCSPLPSLPISLINLPGARDINDEGMSCWTKESGHPQIKGTDSSHSWLFFFYFVEERRQKNNSESRLLKLTENNLVQANTNWLISNSMLMSLKSSDFGQICEISNVSIWGRDSVQAFPDGPGHPRRALDVDLSGLGSPRLEWFRLEL